MVESSTGSANIPVKRWLGRTKQPGTCGLPVESHVFRTDCRIASDKCNSSPHIPGFSAKCQPAERHGFSELALLCFGNACTCLSSGLAARAVCDLWHQFTVCGRGRYRFYDGTRSGKPRGWLAFFAIPEARDSLLRNC